VILLDLKMPGLNGWDVLQRLRADRRTEHVPVVVVSSSSREGDVRESYRLGANSFVVKRFQPEQPGEYLVDVARYWLELNRGLG
jgi:two-component system response regulator